jgi:hypothetical protein
MFFSAKIKINPRFFSMKHENKGIATIFEKSANSPNPL